MKINQSIISLCREFMETNGITYEEAFKQNIRYNFGKNKVVTNEELGLNEISVALAGVDNDTALKHVEEKLSEEIDGLVMLILTSSVQYQKRIEDNIAKRKNDNSNIKVLMIGKDNDKNNYEIRIASRIQALHDEIQVPKEIKKTERVNGYVFSAYLKDIVDIYDEIGDELFRKNVRLHVKKDSIGVGKEIKDTLRNNPDQFWFFNNGITVVTNKAIDLSKSDSIQLEKKKENTFSVVNGAQTISAAHEFMKSDGESDENIQNAEKALVLLRIVSVEEIVDTSNEGANCSAESMSEKISKALNRQKPIEPEDLAYYSTFVKTVNRYYIDAESQSKKDDRYFCIIRRGETEGDGEGDYEHSLTLIARAIRASGYTTKSNPEKKVYSPWRAVNTYNAAILKTDKNELKNDELFKTSEINDSEQFLKHYQYINLAIFVYKRFGELKREITLDANQNKAKIFCESGSWYFVTYFCEWLLGDKKNQRLKPNCIKDFDEYISKNDLLNIIKFFLSVFDADDKFTLKNLRQEEAYKNMNDLMGAKLSEMEIYKEMAQRLLSTD